MGTFELKLTRSAVFLRGDELTWLLVRGASWGFVITSVGQLLRFGSLTVLARILGVESYGVYIYVLTWFQIALLASIMGLNSTTIRFVSEYEAAQKWPQLGGYLRWAVRRALVNAVVMAAGAAVIVVVARSMIGREALLSVLVAALVLPPATLLEVSRAALLGCKDVVKANLPGFVVQPCLLLAAVGGLYWLLPRSIQAPAALLCYLFATLTALLLSFYWLRRQSPQPLREACPVYLRKEWLAVTLPLLLLAGMHVIQTQADTAMIGILINTADAGIYNAASKAAHLPALGLTAVNAILAPIISKLYSQNQMADLQRIVTLSARGTFLVTLGAAAALCIAGSQVLALFGSEFTVAYVPLLILAGGQVVNSLSGSVGWLMTMTGGHQVAAAILAGSALLNVSLNACFIPLWGIQGAACATAISTAVLNIVLFVLVWKRLRIWCLPVPRSSRND